eukprot:9346957-Alexandrium_andersonii.AAC.1
MSWGRRSVGTTTRCNGRRGAAMTCTSRQNSDRCRAASKGSATTALCTRRTARAPVAPPQGGRCTSAG